MNYQTFFQFFHREVHNPNNNFAELYYNKQPKIELKFFTMHRNQKLDFVAMEKFTLLMSLG